MLRTAKRYWPYFLPIWIFPIVYLIGGIGAGTFGYGMEFFRSVTLPLLFVCLIVSTSPLRRRDISHLQTMFWGGVVPLMVWIVAVCVRLEAIKLLH